MKYPIYTLTENLFGEGNNLTEYRARINWFDAVYQDDDRRIATIQNQRVSISVKYFKERISQKKSDLAINDIP